MNAIERQAVAEVLDSYFNPDSPEGLACAMHQLRRIYNEEQSRRIPMKQITEAQALKLATENKMALNTEIRFCQADWIKDNASYIADIEAKRVDKTYFGEFPKGWRHEMIRASKERAKKDLLARFLAHNCMLLDGAIWLNNWEIITSMENKAATTETP